MSAERKYEYMGFKFFNPPTDAQKRQIDKEWGPVFRALEPGTVEYQRDQILKGREMVADFNQIDKISESDEEKELRKNYWIDPKDSDNKEKLLDCLARKAAGKARDKERDRLLANGYDLGRDYRFMAESANREYDKAWESFWRDYRIFGDKILDPFR